jgi:hypothetical protein
VAEFVTRPCRSCQAPLIWAVTAGGRPMPVDAEPGPGGLVALTARPGAAPLAVVVPAAGRVQRAARAARTDLRRTHMQTCPDRAHWRRS